MRLNGMHARLTSFGCRHNSNIALLKECDTGISFAIYKHATPIGVRPTLHQSLVTTITYTL